MKRLLLFAAVLTFWGNLPVCYADAPKGEIPDQTVKVLKQTEKGHDGKPDSTYVEVSLMNTKQDYCYFCPSENTWHIYTRGDKVVYQGGECRDTVINNEDLKKVVGQWCRLRQEKAGTVFTSGNRETETFVNTKGFAYSTTSPTNNRILQISSSPRLELVSNDGKEIYSFLKFHHRKEISASDTDALTILVRYKDSNDRLQEMKICKDTTLAAGSKIESIKISKKGKDASAVKSIHCGVFNEDCKDFIHLKDTSWTIPFSEMGVSEGSAVKVEIDYLTLDDKCIAVGGNLKKYNIAIDNHSGLVETFASPLAKAIGVVMVLLLAVFCVGFCLKRPDRNRHESAPAQKTQKNSENHGAKTNNDEPDIELLVEKQKKDIAYLQGERRKDAKEIETLNGQLQSAQANLNGEKNRTANLQRAITAKNEELETYKGKLSKVQGDCALLRKDKEKLKTELQNIDSEYKKHEAELTESYSRQIEDLSKAVDSQRDKFTKELAEKEEVHEKLVEQMCDRHQKETDSIRQENRHEIETLTADFNAKNKIFTDDSRQRMEGGKKLLEEIFDDVNRLSSSALSTSAYGRWIEQMLDGESSNSLPVFYETFATNEQPFETYRNIRTLIESSVSDVNSWINTLARLASYVSSDAIASDMRKDGADIQLLTRAFERMKVFMALYGYQCIAPKLFTGTVEECSDEFVRDNTDLFINKISGAVFREVKSGVVCDFSSVACVKLVEPSEGNRLIKGKVNSL